MISQTTPAGASPREARQVDRRLRLTHALEHAPGAAAAEDGRPRSGRAASTRGRSRRGSCARGRQLDAGRDAFARVDRDRIGGTESRLAARARRRNWSSSERSSVRQRQITPRPCVAMKLIASGVANSAAMVRSPSFSRSGASTTTTNLPARTSSIASSIVANAVSLLQSHRANRIGWSGEPSTYLASTSTSRLTSSPGLERAEPSSPRAYGRRARRRTLPPRAPQP